jgi:hypothetical protein
MVIAQSRGLLRLVKGDLEPPHPFAITLPAVPEAIDAFRGAKLGLPRVVSDETKLAVTDCASRGSASSKTFVSVKHCCLLLGLS